MEKDLVVKTQEALNDAKNYNGRVIIQFGTLFDEAIVTGGYKYSVVAWGNSSVVAWGNSSVVAWGNSSVVARENSSVVARENSSVVARENSSVKAQENSSVKAWENSSVKAQENSSVKAWENSSVEAWENSSVVAWGNSSVEAWGNVQVLDATRSAKITTHGNSRIVYSPQTIDEYIDYYGIEEFADGTITLYKAVHKDNQGYFSDYSPSFRYNIGEAVETKYFDESAEVECGEGIHLAHMNWALDFGRGFGRDLAILELKVKKEDIVFPIPCSGKVRARKVEVIREIPLKECGLYGKILARRYAKNDRKAEDGV